MVKFNGALYSYVHNLQGDIVGIVDSAGSLVVEYKYDAWGKPTLVRTLTTAYEALAELNPFRYRGYVYDEETGLYYLQNRYYSAQKLRFLIPDASFGERYINVYNRLNVYRYCGNSPIMFCDPDGTIAIAAIGIGAIGTFFKYVVLPPIIGYGVSETIKAAVNEATGSGSSAIRRMRAHIAAEEIEAHPSPKPLASPSPAAPSSTIAPPSAPEPAPAPTIFPPAATPIPAMPPLPPYPGNDPMTPPDGYEWRGKGPQGSREGSYYNPETGESLHPDLNHPEPIKPHWDYKAPGQEWIRLFPPE